MSLELIKPALRSIWPLIEDPAVSEIMANGDGRWFVDRGGRMEAIERPMDALQLTDAVCVIAHVLNQDITESSPILNARLPDGSRVCAIVAPVSLGDYPTLAIRKFLPRLLTIDELIAGGTLTTEVFAVLVQALGERQNIVISGSTSAGKTTLLNSLVSILPRNDRLVVIEDTAEIKIAHPNVVRLEAREPLADRDAVTIRQLLEASLRLRPDRIILGEVRTSDAAYELLQAMNTGHSGTLTTIHANTALDALKRLARLALRAHSNSDHSATRAEVADVVRFVLHLCLDREPGCRRVAEFLRVDGYDLKTDQFVIENLTCAPLVDRGTPGNDGSDLLAHEGGDPFVNGGGKP